MSTAAPGVTISNVSSTRTQVTFKIEAGDEAAVDDAMLTFTTGLGSDSATIAVAARVPDVLTDPNPISVPPDGQLRHVDLVFSEDRAAEQSFSLSISDPSIATLAQSAVTVPPGQTHVAIDITGRTIGATVLNVDDAPERFLVYAFPVFVSERSVGDAEGKDRAFTHSVGVVVGSDDAGGGGGDDAPNPLLSAPVGVSFGVDDPTAAPTNPTLSALTGVIFGPALKSMEPPLLDRGTSLELTLTGFNLQSVDSITVSPPDDITVGAFSIAADGRQITVPVTVDAAAATGDRPVMVSTPDGDVGVFDGPMLHWVIQ